MTEFASVEEAVALSRHGALSRTVFGKPRGSRNAAAVARSPTPGHYTGTTAAFDVRLQPFQLDMYLQTARLAPDEAARAAAVAVLGEFGDGTCVAVLSDMLHGPATLDGYVRRRAAIALGDIGGPEAEASLWSALECVDYPRGVRESALLGLLDLLADGWEDYTFARLDRLVLSRRDRERLLQVREDIPYVVTIVGMFNEEPRDVELKCAGCGAETLATDGRWIQECWRCGGCRGIVKEHDHVLSYAETRALGFTIVPAGICASDKKA